MAKQVHKEDPTVARQAIQWLREHLEGAVLDQGEFQGQAWVVLDPRFLVEALRGLRDEETFRFDYLRDLCGLDNLGVAPYEKRFQVVYQLYSLERRALLRVKVDLPEENPSVDSLCSLFEAANWQEREAYDMYGIRFVGHPDLRRILMPEEYAHFPQRKDFPLEGVRDSLEV